MFLLFPSLQHLSVVFSSLSLLGLLGNSEYSPTYNGFHRGHSYTLLPGGMMVTCSEPFNALCPQESLAHRHLSDHTSELPVGEICHLISWPWVIWSSQVLYPIAGPKINYPFLSLTPLEIANIQEVGNIIFQVFLVKQNNITHPWCVCFLKEEW